MKMKTIAKYTSMLTLPIVLLISCEHEPDLRYPENQEAVAAYMVPAEGSDQYIDFNNPGDFALEVRVDLMYDDPFQKIAIVVARNGDLIHYHTLKDNITSVPQTVTITSNDILAAIPGSSIQQGDQYDIYLTATLEDGTILPGFTPTGRIAYSTAVQNSLTVFYGDDATFNVTVAVPCESNLEGTYTVVANGVSTDPEPTPDENPAVNFTSEVTLEKSGNFFTYTMSDFSGGLYYLWYDIYGYPETWPCEIQDLCGEISYLNLVEGFGSPVSGGGSVDPVSGVITINGRADEWGDTWTLVLTPKE